MAPPSAQRPALLVVEDDDVLREVVGFVLSGEGYEIVLAASGEEALALIATVESFDGLYTDINLPGLVDGLEVGEAFHRMWPTKPIVYASAHFSAHKRMAPTGVFLHKPFDLERLVAVLTSG
jgi:CheY-like chemotaxis protein